MILDASAVLMMSIMYTFVNEANHHDPILEASQEHLSGQVMEKMASPRKCRSLSPKRNKHIVQERTLVVKERERESRYPGIQFDTFVPLLRCEIFVSYTAHCRGCV